jgi:hypothetical protein
MWDSRLGCPLSEQSEQQGVTHYSNSLGAPRLAEVATRGSSGLR